MSQKQSWVIWPLRVHMKKARKIILATRAIWISHKAAVSPF